MAGKRNMQRSLALVVLAVAAAGIPPTTGVEVAAEPGAAGGAPVSSLPERPEVLPASTIDDISATTPTLAMSDPLTTRLNKASTREAAASVTVEVLPAAGTDVATVAGHVGDLGGTVVHSVPGYLMVRLPLRQVPSLRAAPGVATVRQPVDYRRHSATAAPYGSVTSEHVSGVSAWHERGLLGAGAKVGIIDIFDAAVLDQQVALGDLAPIPAERRMCSSLGVPCPFGTPGFRHGNAVAEVIHDTAPGVELYLAEVATLYDYYVAINWFAARGVQIINHSSTGPFDGPGDGTGPSAQVVDHAVNNGIAWFNSAGNSASDPAYTRYAGAYYRLLWNDPDNDRWLNFAGTDESLNVYCGALQGLRWNDWGQGAAATDYQLYISDYNPARFITPVLYSDANQRAGAVPVEGATLDWLCNDDPAYGPVYDTNKDDVVQLWVRRRTESTVASAIGDILEIRVNGGFLEYSMSAYSGSGPFADTKNPGAAAVGAVQFDNRTASWVPAWYSAVGPTNDGRPKPDVLTPTCVSTVAYGARSNGTCDDAGFAGTSAASPVAAGMAALGRGTFGAASPAQLVGFVTKQAADANRYAMEGMGAPRQPQPNSLRSLSPRRLLDTRNAIGVPTTTRVTAGQLININVDPGFIGTEDTSAVVLNVTFVQTDGAGYVQVFPRSGAFSGSSASLTVSGPNSVSSVMAVVPTNARRGISVYASVGGHIIIDRIGVMTESVIPSPREPMTTLRPFRILDTSTCIGLPGCPGTPPPAGTTAVTVVGRTNPDDPSVVIPADARAVLVSITARQPAANGFVRAKPANNSSYQHSNLNVTAGGDATGLALVELQQGQFLLDQSTAAHVSVDIVGYTVPGSAYASVGMFVPMPPTRILNTRQPAGSPPVSAGTVLDIAVPGVPESQVGAILGTLSTVGGAGAGSTQLWSGADPDPSAYRTSSLPGGPGATSTAAVTTVIDRTFRARSSVNTHLVFDIAGWFVGLETPLADDDVELITGQVGDDPTFAPSALTMRISTDGSMVAFETDESLVPSDTIADSRDLYLWRRATRSFSRIGARPYLHQYDWIAGSTELLVVDVDFELVRVDAITSATTVITDGLNGRPNATSKLFSRSNDATLIAMFGQDGSTLVLDLTNNTSMTLNASSVVISPNGQWIMSSGNGPVTRWARGNSTPTTFVIDGGDGRDPLAIDSAGVRVVYESPPIYPYFSESGFILADLATRSVERRVISGSAVFSDSLGVFVGMGPGSTTPLRPSIAYSHSVAAGPLLSGPSVTLNVRADGATAGYVYGHDVSGDGAIAGVLTFDPLDPGSVPPTTTPNGWPLMYLVTLS